MSNHHTSATEEGPELCSVVDEVYGVCETCHPVLAKLIASQPVQRLKGIHQSGASWLVRPFRDVSRYEHVVGTMILIRLLGGSLEEQVAGLLHDVSHTAFSHVSDRVLGNLDEDHHEALLREVVRGSEIPAILAAAQIDVASVLDDARWSILEQPIPDLCADRIDYALRDLKRLGKVTESDVRRFVEDITPWRGKLALRTQELAEWFVWVYTEDVDKLCMDPVESYAHGVLAHILRVAMRESIIDEQDLFLDDASVLNRLRDAAVTHKELARLLGGLHEKVLVEPCEDSADLRLGFKERVVDPLVLVEAGTRVARLSELSDEAKRRNEMLREKMRRGVGIRVVIGTVPE